MAADGKKLTTKAVPCIDHNSRHCIELARIGNEVQYVTLTSDSAFDIERSTVKAFDERYKPVPGYPIERACGLVLAYARKIGASQEVMDHLGKYVSISTTERSEIMATAKKRSEVSQTRRADDKPAAKAKAKPKTTLVGVTKPDKAAKAKTEKPAGEPRESASSMFQDLIMDGKLTDDQIFAKVKDKFGLDDKKRGYVSWYRNKLKKDGKKPPEAK